MSERDATRAEIKYLKLKLSVLAQHKPLPEETKTRPAVEKLRASNDNMITEFAALRMGYKGPHREEINSIYKSLGRAIKAERAPAKAEIARLRAEINNLSSPASAAIPKKTHSEATSATSASERERERTEETAELEILEPKRQHREERPVGKPQKALEWSGATPQAYARHGRAGDRGAEASAEGGEAGREAS
jgi:hypothetical protein